MDSLKAVRKTTGVTQKVFSELLGVTHSYYRQLEAGHQKLSPAMAKKVAEATGCGLEYPPEHGGHMVEGRSVIRELSPIGIKLTCGETSRPFTREHFEQWRLWCQFRDALRPYLQTVVDAVELALQAAEESGRGRELVDVAIKDLPARVIAAMTPPERRRAEELASNCGFLHTDNQGRELSIEQTLEEAYRAFLAVLKLK